MGRSYLAALFSEKRRPPMTERFSPENAALLLIDHQLAGE